MSTTTTQGLEDAIVDLLQAKFTALTGYTTVEVAPLPSMVSEFSNLVDGQQIWVSWHGVKGGQEDSTESLYQQCTYQFGVIIRARKLRDAKGIYNLIDYSNIAILGKRPEDGCGWLKLVKWEIKGEENGVFTAVGVFECPGIPLFEQYDLNANDGAALVTLTHVEQ